jgi:hypothetical protein
MPLDTCLKHHFLLAMPGQAGDYFGKTITTKKAPWVSWSIAR